MVLLCSQPESITGYRITVVQLYQGVHRCVLDKQRFPGGWSGTIVQTGSSSLTLVAAAQAKTLLEATADANNKNAQDVALKKYKAEMEQVSIEAVLLDMLLTHPLQVAGVGKRYCEPSRLDDRHDSFKVSCMEYFGVLPR